MRLFVSIAFVVAILHVAAAQDTAHPPLVTKPYELSRFGGQLPGPLNKEEFPAWLADLKHWRRERLVRMGYNGADYSLPSLRWTQSNFIQAVLLVWDRYFYSSDGAQYTVDRYVDDVEKRYGGVDSVLLWFHYPNIGIDDRNQYDRMRDLPDGVPGLRKTVADFHRRGVRVMLPVIPWDQGTHDQGSSDWTAMTGLAFDIGADGVYGDTLNAFPRIWRAASDSAGNVLALEPQNALLAEQLSWNHMTWGEDWQYSFVPTVSHHKWLEPHHMVHVIRRDARDRTDDIQHAFFNGIGLVAWENIWGQWNGISDRDSEAIRRTCKLERKFRDLTASPEWEPHTPTLQFGVFASEFPAKTEVLWTIVNRNEYGVAGEELRVPHRPNVRYYDLWHGEELTPGEEAGSDVLSFELEAHGYGAVLSLDNTSASLDLPGFLSEMHSLSQEPLSRLRQEWKSLPQRVVDIPPTQPVKTVPAEMVRIPGGIFDFHVSGVEVEGENQTGVDVQYPWESSPRRHHDAHLIIPPFYMDRDPVTNAEYKKFLDATGYHPRDNHNFLKHWNNGTYPAGWENKPVTWVSIEDARAYAAWAGKRLPHEWEWQYAAQGSTGRIYPWGNEWNPAAVPQPDRSREMRAPTDVSAYPLGASLFGIVDMVGNVWQWTDEYVDEHTRSAVIRGGSYYQPQGSEWYFPNAYRLDQHAKYLLMAPSLDRSATIGFRCVVDSK